MINEDPAEKIMQDTAATILHNAEEDVKQGTRQRLQEIIQTMPEDEQAAEERVKDNIRRLKDEGIKGIIALNTIASLLARSELQDDPRFNTDGQMVDGIKKKELKEHVEEFDSQLQDIMAFLADIEAGLTWEHREVEK